MILRPTLTFVDKRGETAWVPVRAFDSIEAGERAIDLALAQARLEGGRDFALRLETPHGEVRVYRWLDEEAAA